MKRDEILDTAKALICGQRAQDYGDAYNNFSNIADAWTWWLGPRLKDALTPNDAAMMMALLKMARLMNSRLHVDSYHDLAGYIALAAEVENTRALQEKVEK